MKKAVALLGAAACLHLHLAKSRADVQISDLTLANIEAMAGLAGNENEEAGLPAGEIAGGCVWVEYDYCRVVYQGTTWDNSNMRNK